MLALSGDPRRPYPTDLEMRSGMLGHMANLPTNGVNGHLPGDALAAGRLPGEFIHRCADVCCSSMFRLRGCLVGVQRQGRRKSCSSV